MCDQEIASIAKPSRGQVKRSTTRDHAGALRHRAARSLEHCPERLPRRPHLDGGRADHELLAEHPHIAPALERAGSAKEGHAGHVHSPVALPDGVCAVCRKRGIAGNDSCLIAECLCRQQTIERVAMDRSGDIWIGKTLQASYV